MTNPLVEKGSATNSECQLPVGISMPKPLSIAGSLATNCKKYKWSWENYAIVAKLHHFENDFQTVEFLSAIGDDMQELNDGMNFDFLKDRQNLETVIAKFEEICISETNETYQSCVFNNQVQEPYGLLRILAVPGMTMCDPYLKRLVYSRKCA